MQDDSLFRDATGILKVIALGAHRVSHYVPCARFSLINYTVSRVLSRLARISSSQHSICADRREALLNQLKTSRSCPRFSRYPFVPYSGQQTQCLMGDDQLYETSFSCHRRGLFSPLLFRMGW